MEITDWGASGKQEQYLQKTGRSTSYDCTYEPLLICEAGTGVDGIKSPGIIFHTKGELEPFWWFNRGQVYTVQKLVSTHWIDCCVTIDSAKMLVHVGKSVDTTHMELCGQFLGPGRSGQVIVIKCCKLLEGQIVKLTSVNNAPKSFHHTEVEVYGF